MRKLLGLSPIERRYAVVALTAWTPRNCRFFAPGTWPERQVLPLSVVTMKVPAVPAAHTIFELTALTAMNNCLLPLSCGVSFGKICALAGVMLIRKRAAKLMRRRFMTVLREDFL